MKSNKKQRNEILTQAYWRGLLAKHRALLFLSPEKRSAILLEGAAKQRQG